MSNNQSLGVDPAHVIASAQRYVIGNIAKVREWRNATDDMASCGTGSGSGTGTGSGSGSGGAGGDV